MISCSSEKISDTKISKEINERITILNNSYRFNMLPENFQGKQFDNLKNLINQMHKTTSRNELKHYYDSIRKAFLVYNIEIPDDGYSIDNILFNTLTCLDKLIFKYVPSRLNFSNYRLLVVPQKTIISAKDTFDAKIYLTVYDSLYEPFFKVANKNNLGKYENEFYIPSNENIGRYKAISRKKGVKDIEGFAIFQNEIGSSDTLDWKCIFEIK
jgi:hypothetical protein